MNSFVISALKSNSGKTLISMLLLNRLKHKNISAFKCGPDYIDPKFHKIILNKDSHNLDPFFADDNLLRFIFNKYCSDINVVEGVMGLFDGLRNTSSYSTYSVAKTLSIPIILVLDCKGMAYTLIPLLKGLLQEDSEKLIKGVILNRVSESYYSYIKPSIESIGLKVYGYMEECDIQLKSRHLGLLLPNEQTEFLEALDSYDHFLHIDESLYSLNSEKQQSFYSYPKLSYHKIAIAYDECFNFYYSEVLDFLSEYCDIIKFPIIGNTEGIPDSDILIIGGGYPENYVKELSENIKILSDIRNYKGKIIAECGGFMILHNNIIINDIKYPMVGLIDSDVYNKNRLVRFGYIYANDIPAHEFHYFDSGLNGNSMHITKPLSNIEYDAMHISDKLFAGFPHFYYLSNESLCNLLF